MTWVYLNLKPLTPLLPSSISFSFHSFDTPLLTLTMCQAQGWALISLPYLCPFQSVLHALAKGILLKSGSCQTLKSSLYSLNKSQVLTREGLQEVPVSPAGCPFPQHHCAYHTPASRVLSPCLTSHIHASTFCLSFPCSSVSINVSFS